MAGRGIRPGGGIHNKMDKYAKQPPKPFVPHSSDVNIETIIEKINEINVIDVNPDIMNEARVLLIQYFSKYEKPYDKIFPRFHSEALKNSVFGEKFAIFFSSVSNIMVNDVSIRRPVLMFMQKDFENRSELFRSDKDKFLNAVTLLGNVNYFLKINNKRVKVLIGPLFDYLDMVLQGEEEKWFKVLTSQITLIGNDTGLENGDSTYELLQLNLRKALIERNLSAKSKCWIMLALDYISNNIQPMNGLLKYFYLESLGDDYANLEFKIKSFAKFQESVPAQESSAAMNLVRRRIMAWGMQEMTDTDGTNEIFQDISNLKIDEEKGSSGRGLSNSKPRKSESFDVTNARNDDDGLKKRRPRMNQRKNFRTGSVNYDIKDDDGGDVNNKEDEKELYGIQIEKDRSAGGSSKKSDFNTNPSSTFESKEVSESKQDKTVDKQD